MGDDLSICLTSIFEADALPEDVIVVQNGLGDDGSVDRAKQRFPQIHVIRTPELSGYSGPCNAGMKTAQTPYIIILNDDAEVDRGWLAPLIETIAQDDRIAACQPKLLSRNKRTHFDYSGGAGGLIDRFCYPFCLGRIFDICEEDRGQYDVSREIFWASGTSFLIRKSVLDTVGLLDETLWMHMEEIDLCWRLHLSGFSIRSVPSSIVYHTSGGTLQAQSFRKIYFNHRNSLIILLKNGAASTLCRVFPVRLLLEGMTVIASLVRGEWKRSLAVLCSLFWIVFHPWYIITHRRASRAVKQVSDDEVDRLIFQESIVIAYFIRKKRTASALCEY
jgi:GT2 family glycosyltransferase